MKRRLTSIVVLLSVLTVRAELFGFDTVTTNSPNREYIADQLFMETTGSSNVWFSNTGPLDSTISEIYFGTDLTNLNLNIGSIVSSSPEVAFTIDGAKPPNPPGWEEFAHWWSVTIAAADTDGDVENGIDPDEYLELGVNYNSGYSLAELIQSGDLQVALHVKRIGDGGEYSDTFVNNAYLVPEPASLILIGTAGAFVVFMRRRYISD